jgi:hypothetical protein
MKKESPVADVPLDFKEKNCYKNTIQLKKGDTKIPYTKEQILEVIKCKKDIEYFLSNYIKIVSLDEGLILFEPYEYQKEMVKTCKDNRFSVFMCARQLGKCLKNNTKIKVRNIKSGEVKEMTIEDFYNIHENQIPIPVPI